MFQLKAHGTDVKTEVISGFTTFLTMVYIIVVNPAILSAAGVPFNTVFMATIISAVIGTLWMALFANYPIAIAPGLGMNAYFVTVVTTQKLDYAIAFTAVFVAGIIFLLLSLTPFREKLITAIPHTLKAGITAGIGLFIAFLGFRMTGIIVKSDSNLVGLGDLHSPEALLAITGLLITLIFLALRVKGALFIGMISTGIIAFFTGELKFNGFIKVPSMPDLVITNPIHAFGDVITYSLYGVVLSFLLITIFDTTGTMIGVAKRAGLMKGESLPNAKHALLADAVATSVGSMFGTTPTSAYIESSAGVATGGRTGLTTLTVAGLFLVSAFFAPLVGAVSGIPAITAPALIIVGSMMIGAVKEIDWDTLDEAFPAFLVILAMPLTSSIAIGLAFGFISYPILKVFTGKWRELNWFVIVIAILFFILVAFLPH
ncbi:NCS2 family permease [Paenilisteria rocourtiae]|uniref:AGZA family xanthine/uracil permease-like MFS transporter n=1 Tax=Listeria rocourtiae TaxID=647910 RepID=A0A4R6ZPH1_9LIST|nr:NCS2 family permease [Listeria rocourtiae]EUJ47902.1 xanthine/uracil permease [Listeria rocourtiae FSL F6-920]MBC1434857.1 NCS2 family permease [Listeria rocourtiae]MBC1604639.1 NCS2 family permease [Listeria rocourtiae]TDR54457.1 AGZA family xanthine/uracil permease-like MFS transporter [Listeria rocourtiae]